MSYLLLVPYLIFAIYIVVRVTRRRKTWRAKTGTVLLASFLLYLPLGWDVILGRAYFYYLCSTQGGVHVYETVKLGPEYWDEGGRPKFIKENGELDERILREKYRRVNNENRDFSELLNIGHYETSMINQKTGEKLGSLIIFRYFGGWFINHTGFHVGAERCPDASGIYQKLLRNIFILKY